MRHYPEELFLNQIAKRMLDELERFLLHIININSIITEFNISSLKGTLQQKQ
jgi:hypothetical protein